MNIIGAIRDEQLFRPFLGAELGSWKSWLTALRALYGLPIKSTRGRKLVVRCTGRDPDQLPAEGFDTALFLVGRRSGKSRIAAIVGAYEAALAGHEHKLARGETGIVAICAPTKWQAGIVHRYVRAAFRTPLLDAEITSETAGGVMLSNGIEIVILAGDWRTVRGPTLIAAVVDEAAFFGLDEESKVKSDTELIRAIRPGLATTRGKLVVISSPYARRGWCFATHTRNFGNNAGRILVWNSPSRVMNPTLDQRVIDDAMDEDRAAALSEFGGEFRDDVAEFLPRSVVEAAIVRGRKELPPRTGFDYFGFVDVSGGRGDDSALAIAHRKDRKVIVDYTKRYRPPHSPHEAITDMADHLKRFGVRTVTGDNYSADFAVSSFLASGIQYRKAEKPKSALYLELIPRMCSGEIELLDDEVSLNQIAGLERRTRSGGRDIVDHPRGGHDDVANVIAGVAQLAGTPRVWRGALAR